MAYPGNQNENTAKLCYFEILIVVLCDVQGVLNFGTKLKNE
jgi:hypothetical protein